MFSTLRHPKDAIGDFFHEFKPGKYVDLYPVLDARNVEAHDVSSGLASGNYDETDVTISCYVTNRHTDTLITDTYAFVAFHRFRGDEEATGVVAQFHTVNITDYYGADRDANPWIYSIDVTASSGATQGPGEAPIYLATVADYWMAPPDLFGHCLGTNFTIHRYIPADPPDPEHWICIGQRFSTASTRDWKEICDVSLSANGDDLIATWGEKYDIWDGGELVERRSRICSYRLFDATTSTSPDPGFSNLSESYLIKQLSTFYNTFTNPYTRLSTDWDMSPYVESPRISWVENYEVGEDIYYRTKAGRIELYLEEPYSISNSNIISGDFNQKMKRPMVSVNNSGFYFDGRFEACAVFEVPDVQKNYFNKCWLNQSGEDVWGNPEDLELEDGDNLHSPCVTIRKNGFEYVIQNREEDIYINDMELDGKGSLKMSPKIVTNRNNYTDIYASYSKYAGSNCKMFLRQVIP